MVFKGREPAASFWFLNLLESLGNLLISFGLRARDPRHC